MATIPNANGIVSAVTTSASNSFIANWQQLAAAKLKANAAKKAADSAVANAAADPTTTNTQLATDAQIQAITDYNDNIQTDEQTIAENTAALATYQDEINTAQATIETDQANLADPNLDPAAAQDIQNNIDEAQTTIDTNQANIAIANQNIAGAQADLAQQQQGLADTEAQATGTSSPGAVPNQNANPSAYDANGNLNPGYVLDLQGNPVYVGNNYIQGPPVNASSTTTSATNAAGLTPAQRAAIAGGLTTQIINGVARQVGIPTNVVNAFTSGNPATLTQLANQTINQAASQYLTPDQAAAIQQQATLALAQQQQTINSQQRAVNTGDWRVKLSLAPSADYLYNASIPGILAPLASQGGTGGVICPYMPSIDTSYHATYSNYDLTHSNYRGYFYQNSYVDQVTMRAQFTAQNTSEANYLLAVIHFFRSVTKMFYGANDNLRGSPPPLVFLTGLGSYQFAQHPCVVTSFNYTLPADVDYIRALSNSNLGTNQLFQQVLQSTVPTNGSTSNYRLASNGLPPGAMATATPAPNTTDLLNSPTYVPTKMEISISLLPVQSRQQVSQNFNLRDFASGSLLNGGFW